MIARIVSNKWIYFDNITEWEENILETRFSAEQPNSRFIDSTAYGWNGVYCRYTKGKKRIARPFLGELRELAKLKKLQVVVNDERPKPSYRPIPIEQVGDDFLPGITLKQFQTKAIHRIWSTEVGIFDITTGGGKSEIIAAICKAMQCPTAIVAEQRIVIDQIRGRLKLRDVCDEPGLFYAGKMPTGQLIIVGTIQSLSAPTKPPTEPEEEKFKDTSNSTAEQKYTAATKRYKASLKGYKSRRKKAKVLRKLISKCEMLLVDEADLAVSDQYKNLFRYWFKGRRRYGFCVAGDTLISTLVGEKSIASLVDERSRDMVVLSHGAVDSFAVGNIIETGLKDLYELSVGRYILRISPDHLIAKYGGGYIRADDVVPGQCIKLCDDSLIDNFEHLSARLGEFNSGSDLGTISGIGFKFSWASFYNDFIGDCEIRNIDSVSIESIIDSGLLCYEREAMSVEKLHEQKFVGRGEINQSAVSTKVITGFEFGADFDATASVSFGKCVTDFFSDLGIVDWVTSEPFFEHFEPLFDARWGEKDDRDTVTLHHCFLNSFDEIRTFHRMIDAISLKTSGFSFSLIVESFRTVQLSFSSPCVFLVCLNGEPIFYSIQFKHLLFIGFKTFLSSILNTGQLLNTFRTKMLAELPKLAVWSTDRAFEYSRAFVALYGDNVVIPGLIVVTHPIYDHDLCSPNGVLYYVCDEVGIVTKKEYVGVEKMYDVVDVCDNANFYANNVLVHNSGTPFDKQKPVQKLFLQEHLGSIIFKQNRKQVQAAGLIVPLEYHMLVIGDYANKKDGRAFDIALEEDMIYSEHFHRLVAALCNRHKDEGTLILVERDDLGNALKDLIPNSDFIHGKTPKSKRPTILSAFENRELKVLIGGKNVRRGMDLQGGCENLVVATGGKLTSEFDQRLGRGRRLNPRGKTRVYDFYFLTNKYLYEHSRIRIKAAVEMDYRTQVVFPDGSIDGETFIRSQFRKPRFGAAKRKSSKNS